MLVQIVMTEMLWELKKSLCFSAFMLATQLNHLVEGEQLSSNCICQINRFIVNTLKDGRYVVGYFCFLEFSLVLLCFRMGTNF